jgi:phosphoglycolate phosphatase-like HAD superfamily hydrolase
MDREARRLALFDFDNTLFHLGTDWSRLRSDLQGLAQERGIDANGAGVYELAFLLDDEPRARRAISAAELEGLETGLDLLPGQELYRRHAESGSTLAIATHNGREVVEAFFRSRDLPAPAEIFHREALGAWKAESESLAEYARTARSIVVVGDSHHDRQLAERLGAAFVDVEDPYREYYDRKAGELDELAVTYESPDPYKR